MQFSPINSIILCSIYIFMISSDPIIHSKEYYFNLIEELNVITAPKKQTPFKLPPDSIWNTLQLEFVNEKKKRSNRLVSFDLDRDKARIDAAVACDIKRLHAKLQSSTLLTTTNLVLTPRER